MYLQVCNMLTFQCDVNGHQAHHKYHMAVVYFRIEMDVKGCPMSILLEQPEMVAIRYYFVTVRDYEGLELEATTRGIYSDTC